MQGSVPSVEDGRRQHVRYLKASAAVDCLQRNVDAEHVLYTDFLLTFWQASSCPPCCWGFAARACKAPKSLLLTSNGCDSRRSDATDVEPVCSLPLCLLTWH